MGIWCLLGDLGGTTWGVFLPAVNNMAEICGIIGDLKREGEGEYIIPCSTIFGLSMPEIKQLVGEGLKIGDEDPKNDGVEVRGASPFKVMRILCSKFGWTTDGEVVSTEAPGGRTAAIWTLTRKVA